MEKGLFNEQAFFTFIEMDFKEQPQKVGRISKVHGINGGMVVKTSASVKDEDQWPDWAFVYIDTGLIPFKLRSDECFWKDDHHFVVFFNKVDRPEDCSELLGQDLFMPSDFFGNDEPVNFGFSGLKGFEVQIHQQKGNGTVIDYLDISGNPLLVIDWDGTELMVPANDEFILDFDQEKKLIKFELPEGLIDLN